METTVSGQSSQPPAANDDQEPTKKRKRDKYVGKACGPCKRRKIRCGGGVPCESCIRRKKYCVVDAADGVDNDGTTMSGNGSNPEKQPELQALHQRLATLESHLSTLTRALLPASPLSDPNATVLSQSPEARGAHSNVIAEKQPGDTAEDRANLVLSGTSPKDYLSFSSGKNLMTTGRNLGETSVTHALQRVEDRLNELGMPVLERDSAPGTPPMTPLPSGTKDVNYSSIGHRVKRALDENGIEPDRATWDEYLEIYLTEVHLLYPFSTETSISETYEKLWELLGTGNEVASPEIELDKACQMLLGLALGRCTVSTRIHKSEGFHSAGWSLYCTAMDLLGNLLDTVNDDSRPLSSLHSLVLVVIYLLRIDATERAQKVLSLAVIHAQHLGIHLSKTHDDMSTFDSEMFKRTWWCMYVLDRRVSLVLGRPFIIQDNSITVALPRDVEVATPRSVLDFYHMEAESTNFSSITYLNVMVGYSRVVGKVWETLFGAESGSRTSSYVHEYLDSLVYGWMESVPKFLVCDQNNVHQPPITSSPQLFKQRFLVRLRFLYILIMIRSPLRRSYGALSPSSHNVESDTICLQQARSIISMFAQCTAANAVYGFPFLPYLLEATITILSCLTRLPNLRASYKETTEESVRMLTQFCKKSWISGKMARIIFKLGDIIPKIFAADRSMVSYQVNGSTDNICASHQGDSQAHESGSIQPHILVPHSPNSQAAHSSESNWQPKAPTPNYNDSTTVGQGEVQFLMDDSFTDSTFESSMITDFPFEMNFGNAASHTMAPVTQVQGSLGNEKEDFSTPFLGIMDLEWLNELLPQDNRILHMG
ncbi:fungal-specific transcription factor domain-containing protein [Cadophora sp. MPI-SDFR-AT-0126]|nr:fungal-specific transcription factor domain-containing protein [Leotiomycetes sp. MPI-SDFR-AT-0126]